jgi:hypothetical protein
MLARQHDVGVTPRGLCVVHNRAAVAVHTTPMRKKLFLHIGQTKTGSTSLQRFLHGNRAALAERGVFYPPCVGGLAEPGARHHHRHLFTALQDAGPTLVGAEAAWAALAQAVHVHPAPTAVISSELFWHLFVGRAPLRLKALKWMAEQLAEFDVRVVCYLRAQEEWVEAMYNQLVKSGQAQAATQGFDHFLQRPQTVSLMDYERVLQPWAEAFGPQALVVRVFERTNLVAGDVVDDFLSLLGQDDLDGLARYPDAQQRISWPVCDVLMVFNRHAGLQAQREAFVRLLSDTLEAGPPSRLMDADAVRALQALHATGNARVARAYCDRAVLFDPPPSGGHRPVYRGMTMDVLAEALVQVFAAGLPPVQQPRRRAHAADRAQGRPRGLRDAVQAR